MKTHKAVENFYDSFLKSRMINYRLDGNPRIDLAIDLLLPLVRPADVVADIGCGIGIVTEAVAKANPHSRVIGIDISGANIEYAKKTVHRPNISFVQADVTEQFERLSKFAPSGFDIVALIDVIEHIPGDQRPELFRKLKQISKEGAILVLTYPSPEYQKYLAVHDPGELQVVDNIIELDELHSEASDSGWSMILYRKVDVWFRRQYVHCIFTLATDKLELAPRSLSLASRGLRVIDRLFFRRYRKWYYRDRFLQGPGADA